MTAGAAEPGRDRLTLAYLADPNSVHTRRWISFFAERGHRVSLIVDDSAAVDHGLPPEIDVRRVALSHRPRLPGLAGLAVRRALRTALAELDPDVVHAHYLTRFGWYARLANVHPFALTLWGSDILLAPHRSRRARMKARVALRAADLVTYASDQIRDAAVRLGARPERLAFVHFGVDTDRFRPDRADPGALRRLGLEGRRVVFSPRALTPLYRHATVLRAVAALPEDVVVLAGARRADAAHLADLRSLAGELGLESRFVVAPEFSDAEAPTLFATATAVVTVPESDGSPLTLLEAMASGAPVVASDLPGVRGSLAGHPDLLVPVGDADALASALRGVLGLEPGDRERLGQSLRQVVVDRYEYRDNMLSMEEAYRALAGR